MDMEQQNDDAALQTPESQETDLSLDTHNHRLREAIEEEEIAALLMEIREALGNFANNS